MGQRHKHADVIIAWAEGKDVQVWDECAKCWYDVRGKFPIFNEDREHRIKPPCTSWRVALFNNNGNIYTSTADTPEDVEFYEKDIGFVRWLTDWIEYEE